MFIDYCEVKKKAGRFYAYLSFRDKNLSYGPVFLEYPSIVKWGAYPYKKECLLTHTFSAMHLDDDMVKKVVGYIKEAYPSWNLAEKKRPFHVVQVSNAPIHDVLGLPDWIKSLFEPGHYSEQLKWQLGWPNRRVEIDEILQNALVLHHKINTTYDEIHKKCRGRVDKIRPIIKDNLAELSILLSEVDIKNKAVIDTRDHVVDIYLDSCSGFRLLWQQLTADEVKRLPWCFLDTEKKFYQYKELASNCIVSLLFKQCDGSLIGEIHTTENPAKDAFAVAAGEVSADFSILRYDNEAGMVQGVRQKIKEMNPYLLIGHNIGYDIKELNNDKNFSVGIRNTKPARRGFFRFLDRFLCQGMEIVDTYALFKSRDVDYARYTLEQVAGFQKIINYEKLMQLIEEGMQGRRESLNNVFSYAGKDVLVLYHMLCHGQEAKHDILSDLVVECNTFGNSLTEAAHNVASVSKLRKKVFYEETGLYRDLLMPLNLRLARIEAARHGIGELVHEGLGLDAYQERGLIKNVQKFYVNIESSMPPLLYTKCDIISYLEHTWGKHDSRRKFRLSQVLRAFAQDVWIDWWFCIQKNRNLEDKIKECQPELMQTSLEKFRQDKECYELFKKNNKNNKRQNLRLVEEYINNNQICADPFLLKHIFELAITSDSADHRFFGEHGFSTKQWHERLKGSLRFIHEWIMQHEVVYYDNRILFVNGNPDIPCYVHLIPLGNRDVLRGEYGLLYKERGSYRGLEIKEHPTKNNYLFDMEQNAAITDALLENDFEKACGILFSGALALKNGTIEKKLLLYKENGEDFTFCGVDITGTRSMSIEEVGNGLEDFLPNLEWYAHKSFGVSKQGAAFSQGRQLAPFLFWNLSDNQRLHIKKRLSHIWFSNQQLLF